MDFVFVINSMLLGVGLAMDAVSVSLANGMSEPEMKASRKCSIAGVYMIFQWLMPLAGWVCVHWLVTAFSMFVSWVPWIAFLLLAFIGLSMIRGSKGSRRDPAAGGELTAGRLLMQGIATSIDALSVGFAIAHYTLVAALVAATIIALVTFLLCMIALVLGQKIGLRLARRGRLVGGIILIAIGVEILLSGIF